MMSKQTWLRFMQICAVLFGASMQSEANAQECGLSTSVRQDSELNYQPRGDRCEGLYRQRVANRVNLRVVGYHLGRPKVKLKDSDHLLLEVGGFGLTSDTELQIVSLPERVFYQMDTRQITADNSFDWRLDVLQSLPLSLQLSDLGALGCSISCAAQDSETLLSPIRFGSKRENNDAYILLMADVELKHLHATLSVDGELLIADQPIGGRFLPSKRVQRLRLPRWDASLGELSLSAITRSNQRTILKIRLAPPIVVVR